MTDVSPIDEGVRRALEAVGVEPTDEELVMFSAILPVLRERVGAIYAVDLPYDQI